MDGKHKSTFKDYYKVLEVDYDATDEKIRLNYRKLALKWHPDKHKGDSAVTAKFQEINEAYSAKRSMRKDKDFFVVLMYVSWGCHLGATLDIEILNCMTEYDLNGNYEIDKYTLREYLSRFKGMILTCNGLGISHTSIWSQPLMELNDLKEK
ncbi:hypothetical protein Pfo_028018 [Paulownia fortunei]|nr:hypothetical protein Pfo_028018 [Paulownia fortunei]